MPFNRVQLGRSEKKKRTPESHTPAYRRRTRNFKKLVRRAVNAEVKALYKEILERIKSDKPITEGLVFDHTLPTQIANRIDPRFLAQAEEMYTGTLEMRVRNLKTQLEGAIAEETLKFKGEQEKPSVPPEVIERVISMMERSRARSG